MFDCFLAFCLTEEGGGQGAYGAHTQTSQLSPTIKYSFPKQVTAIAGMEGNLTRLGDFAYPRLAQIRPKRFYKPRTFVFTVTLKDGTHAYGFCRKFLSPGPYARLDVGSRYPEVLCFVSKSPEFDLFSSLLDCLHVRRILSPETMEEFLVSLSSVKGISLGQSFSVRSHCCKLLCEYRFQRPRGEEQGDPSCLVGHLSAYLLHYTMGAVLCERRIVFLGRNEEVLSGCIHGIMALLAPFKWPHIFVPILPENLIQYAAAPSPFIVGVLTEHEAALKKQPLGDIVFVDLDENKIRYGDHSEPVVPFGLCKEKPKKGNGGKPKEDPALFTSELATIYARTRKNVSDTEQQLKCLWMAFFLFIFGYISSYADDPGTSKINVERFLNTLDDNDLRSFVRKFSQTQMFDIFIQERFAQRKNKNLISGRSTTKPTLFDAALRLIRGRSSLSEIKRAIQPLFLKRTYYDKDSVKQMALDKTSNSSIVTNAHLVARFGELARSTYNCVHSNCVMSVTWKRIESCSGRNWKYGYNALELLAFLVSAGAESALASIFGHIKQIHRLMHFELESTLGISKEARGRVRHSARKLYALLQDRHMMQYLRGPQGHKLIKGVKAAQHRQAEAKLANAVGGVYPDYIPPFSTIHTILNPGSSIKSSTGLEHLLRAGIHPELAALNTTVDLLDLDGLRKREPMPLRQEVVHNEKHAAVRARKPPAPPPVAVAVAVATQHRKPPPPPQVAQAQLHSVQTNVFTHPQPPPPPQVAIAQLHLQSGLASEQQLNSHDPGFVKAIARPSVTKVVAQTESKAKEKVGKGPGPGHPQKRTPPPIPAHPHQTNLADKLKHRTPPVPHALEVKPPPRGVSRRRPPAPMKP